MALRRRKPDPGPDLASLVEVEVAKALSAQALQQAGARSTDLSARTNAMAGYGLSPAGVIELPRPQEWSAVPFGPSSPVPPAPFDPLGPNGRTPPRRWEYPVSWNLPGLGAPFVPWQMLRDFADRVDIARQCIKVRKNELVSLDWDIVVSDRYLARMARASGYDQNRIGSEARAKYNDEIARVRDWWDMPDRSNGLGFADWMTVLLEEHFVLDALTIYPHLALNGDLFALEIIDGATIKPLLDNRGNTPAPPAPAYQQILWGFPRGEYVASSDADLAEFASDQLIYRPRYRRTYSPYGMSDTEVALTTGSIYLARQQWIRGEYDQSSRPDALMKIGDGNQMTPEQWTAWEQAFNARLAGSRDERLRWSVIPPGFEPFFPPSTTEKYKPDFDEYLIKLLCSAYDVQPTELGFTPRQGLGGSGHEEGQENITYRRALRPATQWLTQLLNFISWAYLGMPKELTFQFLGLEAEDEHLSQQVLDSEVRGAQRTLNDARAAKGLPLYDFPEADWPLMSTGRSLIAFTKDGPVDITQMTKQQEEPTEPEPAPVDPNIDGKQRELRRFAEIASRRIGKGEWRDFEFFANDAFTADRLNKLGAAGDLDGITALAAGDDHGPARWGGS